jgi:very-short-patch-repair endonuclease
MSAAEGLRLLGGVGRRRALVALVGRAEVDRALDRGEISRVSRGVYAVPEADAAGQIAQQLGGVLSLTSAALHHGWAVKTVPDKPHVTVPRWRRLPATMPSVHLHWSEDALRGVATSPEVTLEQCLRHLPFDEALAVADSALRAGFGAQALAAIADRARGPGSPQVRRVAELATPRAANPFESALRAIAADVPGLRMEAQVVIRDGAFVVRPDLVDERLRIVAEADSFEWHGGRAALAADARRYNMLVVAGWVVLRFSWEDVMFRPDEVRHMLIQAVALVQVLGEVGLRGRRAA